MICDRCGEREGSIRYTEYADGEARRMKICPECARELGFGDEREADAPPSAGQVHGAIDLEAVLRGDAELGGDEDDRRCERCGLTAAELSRASLFGCEVCYETFGGTLEILFVRLHGATRHRGRTPGASS